MFGLNNGEGNHGEDVKEYWFYLDSTPTHSYLKCQYKYPQRAFPYEDLVTTNGRRSKQEMEHELLVTAYNRGPDAATVHLLPTLWFRNTWSWGEDVPKPTMAAVGADAVRVTHHELGDWLLSVEGSTPLLFCENETNNQRLFGEPNASPYVKDGVDNYLVNGPEDTVNPDRPGTKMAAHHVLDIGAGQN